MFSMNNAPPLVPETDAENSSIDGFRPEFRLRWWQKTHHRP
jgi:hypothetical protein